jgi:hypothetical protein
MGVLVRVAGDGATSDPPDVSLDEPTFDAALEEATVGRSVVPLETPSGVPPEATGVGIVEVVAMPGMVGGDVPPESPPDASPEAATVGGSVSSPVAADVGNVDAVSASRLVGGDVPPDPSEDMDDVGAVVPATSPDGGGVGSSAATSDDASGVGTKVSPDTPVVAGVGAGEESPPSSGQVTVSAGKAYGCIVRG